MDGEGRWVAHPIALRPPRPVGITATDPRRRIVPYRVTFKADYVEKRSRLTTFFRLLLAIPHIIFLYFYGLAAGVLVIVAWFALLFTGRYPQGMYDFVSGSLRYSTRVYGYLWLLTDEYPPFSGSAEV